MIEAFREHYRSAEGMRVFRAPGRVNLIGEHTDYNLGFVLPMALELATLVAAAPSNDSKLRIYSEDRLEMREWDASEIADLSPARHWTDYPIGVAQQLIQAGFPVAPANLLIRSTVPAGGGLSSSAALEVSTALALLNGREIPKLDLARLCQRAERQFVGMPCGIMDQYIALFGRAHSAVKIDCRSLEHQLVSLPSDMVFLAVNTMVKHSLAGSAYQDRVRECAAAAEALGVASLRDATRAQVATLAGNVPPAVARRAQHVVTENERVEQFVEASGQSDLARMGKLLVASHRSLQHDYEVSSVELDFLVDAALTVEGVYGARMTGGGFGGCTVTMLRTDAVERFTQKIVPAFEMVFGPRPAVYECRPGDGAGEITGWS